MGTAIETCGTALAVALVVGFLLIALVAVVLDMALARCERRGRRARRRGGARWAALGVVLLWAWTVEGGQVERNREVPAWNYIASNDGRSHWLFLTAVSAEVETRFGVLPPDSRNGLVLLNLDALCREGEAPLVFELVRPPHPEEPETPRELSLRGLWWALTGTTPAPRTEGATVTLGVERMRTAWVRPAVVYEFEPDYRAVLDAGTVAAQLLGLAPGAALRVQAAGNTAIEARFEAPGGYRARLRQMWEACGVEGVAGRR